MFKYSSVPAYSFQKSESRRMKREVPGPGAYDPSFKLTELSHGAMLKYSNATSPSPIKAGYPGPGTYSYTENQAGVGYSIPKGRAKDGNFSQVVGPGAYDSLDAFKKFSSGQGNVVFGKEKRSREIGSRLPGPGAYDPKAELFETKGGFLGKGARGREVRAQVPGPGFYSPQPEFPQKGGYSIGKEPQTGPGRSRAPGPGAYDPATDAWRDKRAVAFSKARREFHKSKGVDLGPGAYDSKLPGGGVGYRFGNQERGVDQKENVPGPGAYESQKPGDLFDSKGGIIPKGKKITRTIQAPPPGTYDPKAHTFDSKGAFVPKASRFQSKPAAGPGPGQYTDTKLDNGLSYSINRSRPHPKPSQGPPPGSYDAKFPEPHQYSGKFWRLSPDHPPVSKGPGFYDIPHSIPDVPKYNYPDVPHRKIHL